MQLRKKIKFVGSGLLAVSLVLLLISMAFAREDSQESQDEQTTVEEKAPVFAAENDKCLKCHGQKWYSYENENTGTTIKKTMCPNRVIDTAKFYESNHRTFRCTDCHSPDYETFPHSGELRMETMWTCMDCHGYDENFAQYHFEEIDEQYQKSVHFVTNPDGFSCWKCHDPHTYKTFARHSKDVLATVTYDNNICLSCHANKDRYMLLSDKENVNLIDKHDWLPNQQRHFQKVRCIECHATQHDSLLVSHNIRPKEEAVKNCVECHSQNTILMASLYKHDVVDKRSEYGFLNGPLLKDYYVIGATRNYYLNVISVVIFLIAIAGIIVHSILRATIINKKKK